MSITDPAHRASLGARIRGILLQPKAEWDRIDGEPATTQGLIMGYAAPLAAIGPVCSAIGMVVFGFGIPGIATYHANPIGAVVSAVVSWVLMLVGVFLVGLIIDALAPTFGGQKNPVQAMKVAVYGSTASWLAGVFGLIPALSMLSIVGLYSLYLYYVGLPKLMKTSEDKAMGYTALVVVCAIVVFLVVGLVTAPLRMIGAAGMGAGGVTVIGDNGTVKLGGAAVNVAALNAASKQMEASANAMQAQALAASTGAAVAGGTATVASADALKALLPAGVAGYARGEVSAESAGAAGMATSHAEAVYTRGDARITLNVADAGAMGGLTGMVGALGVNANKETSTGYERVSTRNGRTTSEEWDAPAKRGKVSVMAGRAIISAEGQGASMDEVRAAAAAVDPARLMALAKG